jgi:hypothetical protein
MRVWSPYAWKRHWGKENSAEADQQQGSGRYRFRSLSVEIAALQVIVEDMGQPFSVLRTN